MKKPRCPYCKDQAQLVNGSVIYPTARHLSHLKFWRCEPCNAHVGCHKGTGEPMGSLANLELRQFRKKAHKAFDPIWKKGKMNRTQAYAWLAECLEVESKKCHIGKMRVYECRRVIELCQHFKKTL